MVQRLGCELEQHVAQVHLQAGVGRICESCESLFRICTLPSAGALRGADGATSGSFLLQGPPELVKLVGPAVLQKIDGKGGGRSGRMQGRASALRRAEEARQLIEAAVSDMEQRP